MRRIALASIAIAMAVSVGFAAATPDTKTALKHPKPPQAFAAKGLTVLSHTFDPNVGMNVWVVQHVKGGTGLFYSPPDGKVFFTGAMWDGVTGANVSDPHYTTLAQYRGVNAASPSPPSSATSRPTVAPTKAGSVPESIKRLGELGAIKEGTAPVGKTLFVFFDPRCPYCKQLYEMTRSHPGIKGRSISWIPVAVLGRKEQAMGMIADIMQRSDPASGLKMNFSGLSSATAKPSEKTKKLVDENESVFWAAFQANPAAGQAAVPVAFFMDKAGRPQMVANPAAVLDKIFAEMN